MASWWEWLISPHEAAFARVFDRMIVARNAVRSAFQSNEAAKAQLVEFYAAFTTLPAGTERSDCRRRYQDIMGATAEANRHLEALSKDLGTLQAAASAAHQGTIPYELVDGEVAVRNIVLHGVTEDDIAAAEGGVGFVSLAATLAVLKIVGALIAVIWTAEVLGEAAVGIAEQLKLETLGVARITAAMGVVPQYPGAPVGPITAAATAGVSIVTLALVGLAGIWLARRA